MSQVWFVMWKLFKENCKELPWLPREHCRRVEGVWIQVKLNALQLPFFKPNSSKEKSVDQERKAEKIYFFQTAHCFKFFSLDCYGKQKNSFKGEDDGYFYNRGLRGGGRGKGKYARTKQPLFVWQIIKKIFKKFSTLTLTFLPRSYLVTKAFLEGMKSRRGAC